MATFLERLQQQLRDGTHVPPPAARHLGNTLVSVEHGRAVMTLPIDDRHVTYRRDAFGGSLSALCDAATAVAHVTTLEDGDGSVTVELKTNYLRPVMHGDLVTATATVLRSGRSIGLIECRVTDSAGRLVAFATSTCMRVAAPRSGSGVAS